MTIAYVQSYGAGARTYVPEGPLDLTGRTGPLPSFRPGAVAYGDAEAEFVYVLYSPVAATTLKQGDGICWDNSYQAYLPTTALTTRGSSFGTFFLNARFGDPAATTGAPWSYTFSAAGVYGIWVQRSGTSLANWASSSVNAGIGETTTTAGQVKAPSSATVSTKAIAGLYFPPSSLTFTANTTSGSGVLTAVSTNQGLVIGAGISGTGIPTGAVIAAINGSTITIGNNVSGGAVVASATGSTVTITMTLLSFTANATNGSTTLTNISNLGGVYPNQAISGTGIPASTTIASINGNPGNYTITLSAAATATGTSVTMTPSQYTECYLRWPYIDKTN